MKKQSSTVHSDLFLLLNIKSTLFFAMLIIFLDNWHWQGVSFYLSSGKCMAKNRTEIVIQLKAVLHFTFHQDIGENIAVNQLILDITLKREYLSHLTSI